VNGTCKCSKEEKSKVLAHMSSESGNHATANPATAWSFETSLPHHIRFVIAALETGSSLRSGRDEFLRG
jgi:hypothetical protein